MSPATKRGPSVLSINPHGVWHSGPIFSHVTTTTGPVRIVATAGQVGVDDKGVVIQDPEAQIEQAFQTVEKQLDDLTSQMADLDNEKKTREGQQVELATKIERAQKRLEKNVQRKGILTAQAAQCAKSIRDLGVLPDEAFGKYERMECRYVGGAA